MLAAGQGTIALGSAFHASLHSALAPTISASLPVLHSLPVCTFPIEVECLALARISPHCVVGEDGQTRLQARWKWPREGE